MHSVESRPEEWNHEMYFLNKKIFSMIKTEQNN